MGTKLNAGDYTRSDLLLIDPDEIEVNDKLNGRWEPHSEDDIDKLANSIAENGQIQPVTVRKVADNRVQLVVGYRRYAAVCKLNKGKKKDDRLKLKCILATANDEESFRKNIKENKDRKSTSPVDDAHNQRRLREEYGWSDTRIAEFYGCSPSMITLLKKILLLPTDVQAKVHRRELALNAAAAMVELTPEEQIEVLKPEEDEPADPGTLPGGGTATPPKGKKGKKARKGKNGTPSSGTITKRIRKIKGNKPEGGKGGGKGKGKAAGSGGKQSRSMAEVRRFFEGLTGPGERKIVRETAEWLLKFFGGTYATDDAAEVKFKELFA